VTRLRREWTAALAPKGATPPMKRAKPRNMERTLQGAIVQLHATALRNPLDAILFAVPNGEERDPIIAGILTGRRRQHPNLPPETDEEAMRPAGQGVLRGVVDLVVLLPGGRVLLIEVKAPKTADYRGGTLSAPQKSFQRAVIQLGHLHFLVESVEQYQTILIEYGVRLKPISFWPVTPVSVAVWKKPKLKQAARPRSRSRSPAS
jgi:hypothetical protein